MTQLGDYLCFILIINPVKALAVNSKYSCLILWGIYHFLYYSFSQPSFGYFNNDDVLDVVVEEDIGNNTKRVSTLSVPHTVRNWDRALKVPLSVVTVDNHPGWEVWWRAVGCQPFGCCQLAETRLSTHRQLLLGLHVLGLDAFRIQFLRKRTAFINTMHSTVWLLRDSQTKPVFWLLERFFSGIVNYRSARLHAASSLF